MRRPGAGVFIGGGAIALSAAIAALGDPNNFTVTLLYAASTVLVTLCATWVTICGAAELGKRRPGSGDRPGFVEFGFLIGLFAVSPLALSGAFVILEALLGAP